jgi:hypothetical protein
MTGRFYSPTDQFERPKLSGFLTIRFWTTGKHYEDHPEARSSTYDCGREDELSETMRRASIPLNFSGILKPMH